MVDQIIGNLEPGQEAEISRYGGVWCTVERSGDGRTLRFVRHTATGWEVYRVVRY
jgi:hypothetical protein